MPTRTRTLVATAVAVFLTAGLAQVPVAATSGVIHACQNKKSGTLRVVKKKNKCTKKEKALKWSVAGPAGPQGPSGTPGANGATGAPGPGATAFAATMQTANLTAATTTSDPVPVGNSVVRFACIALANTAGTVPLINSRTSGSYVTRGVWANSPEFNAGFNETDFSDFTDGTLVGNTPVAATGQPVQVSELSGVLRNMGSYLITFSNDDGSYLLSYSVTTVATLPAPAGPKAYCSVTGWWSKTG